MIASLLGTLFPPKPSKIRMTQEEVENSMRLHALETGLLVVYKADPFEAGVLSIKEWNNGRWRNRVKRY